MLYSNGGELEGKSGKIAGGEAGLEGPIERRCGL